MEEILFDNITVSSEGYPTVRVYIAGRSRRRLERFLHAAVAPLVEGRISEITFSKDHGVSVRCTDGSNGTRTKITTYTFSTSSEVYKNVVGELNSFKMVIEE